MANVTLQICLRTPIIRRLFSRDTLIEHAHLIKEELGTNFPVAS